jgi:hypothetical protein
MVAFGGYPRKSSVAVKAEKILWTGAVTTYVPTPLAFGDHPYWVNDDAEAVCMELATGKLVTERRVCQRGTGLPSVFGGIQSRGQRITRATRPPPCRRRR